MDLLTLDDYKSLLGISETDTSKDDQITSLLPAASRAVRMYTGRSFEVAGTPSPRTFIYDGGGFLDIDDCTAITAVSTDAGYPNATPYTMATEEFTPLPYRESPNDDPYYYLAFHSFPGSYSPEMGFERNLDKLEIVQRPILVTVTATWGWPQIPMDVKLAVAWTAQETLSSPASSDLRSEAIESYSRSWGQSVPTLTGPEVLTPRAQSILTNYIKMVV